MEEERIHSDPAVMMGKPVVAGTRVTVELILEKLPKARRSSSCFRHILV